MKITKAGKVTIDAENIHVDGFHFERSPQDPTKEKEAFGSALLVSLDWLEQRIAEIREEISSNSVEITIRNSRMVK